jgi:SNF2 family DNA or RNA helicase
VWVWTDKILDEKGRPVFKLGGFEKTNVGGWHFEGPTKNVPKFADALKPYFPRLAEALSRAFGGIAEVMDEEREKCAPLLDMSAAPGPQTLTDAKAIQAVRDVGAAFQARGPSDRAPLDFQWVGIGFAKLSGYRCLIGDAPGLGKTIQGLGCIISDPDQNLPALVVAPKNVVYNWTKEAGRWLPRILGRANAKKKREARVLPPGVWVEEGISGSLTIPRDFAGLVVCSWETLTGKVDELSKFGFKLVIADEAHYAKSPKAARSKALKFLSEQIPGLVLLTGTPIKNVVSELWSLLSMINPDAWGKLGEFKRKFAGSVETFTTETGVVIEKEKGVSAENKPELLLRLACSMIRRRKMDVLKDLPPKRREQIVIELTPDQRATYNRAEDDFFAWFEGEVAKEIIDLLATQGIDPKTLSKDQMRQIEATVAERIERARKAEILVQMGKLRQLVGLFKTPHALRLAQAMQQRGEACLLWCQHRPVVTALSKALDNAGVKVDVIDGSTPAADRADITDDFQEGKLDVLVVTQAAKEGLTLVRANTAFFVERYWTPADEVQAEDRIHRIGQIRSVTIYDLHVPQSIDDKMAALIESKRAIVDEVLGDEEVETAFEEATTTDLVKSMLSGRMKKENPRRRILTRNVWEQVLAGGR